VSPAAVSFELHKLGDADISWQGFMLIVQPCVFNFLKTIWCNKIFGRASLDFLLLVMATPCLAKN
jgi:hypothetical protein